MSLRRKGTQVSAPILGENSPYLKNEAPKLSAELPNVQPIGAHTCTVEGTVHVDDDGVGTWHKPTGTVHCKAKPEPATTPVSEPTTTPAPKPSGGGGAAAPPPDTGTAFDQAKAAGWRGVRSDDIAVTKKGLYYQKGSTEAFKSNGSVFHTVIIESGTVIKDIDLTDDRIQELKDGSRMTVWMQAKSFKRKDNAAALALLEGLSQDDFGKL